MAIIIDKRSLKSPKSLSDKERFKQRKKDNIKAIIDKVVEKGCITDFVNGKSVKIPISDDIESLDIAPENIKKVFIGNSKYRVGDTIPKPNKAGQGSGAGDSPGEFTIELTGEEIEEFIFKELELPDIRKTHAFDVEVTELKNAGYQKTGLPSNISVIRSFSNSLGRKVALEASYNDEIERLTSQLTSPNDQDPTEEDNRLYRKILELEELRRTIPYLEELDLRYRCRQEVPIPISKGVLFCMMDVSGSMDEDRKSIAKTMFLLLYLFTKNKYEKFDIVFVKHHTEAVVCNEKEFFYAVESGGTSFMSGYKTIQRLIMDKYNSTQYNIFIAQGSDGENWGAEADKCREMVYDYFLPIVNLFLFLGCGLRHNTIDDFVKYLFHNKKDNLKFVTVVEKRECLEKFIETFKRKEGIKNET